MHTHLGCSEKGNLLEGENIKAGAIRRRGFERLRRHVERTAWGVSEARHFVWREINNASISEVADLGYEDSAEKDVPRGQISVNDGRSLAVEVVQAPRNVGQESRSDTNGDVERVLQQAVQVDGQPLHEQHGHAVQLRAGRSLP